MVPELGFSEGSLMLKPIAPERDAPGLYELFLDERMHRFTGNRVPENVKEVRRLLEDYAAHPGIRCWAVWDGEIFIGTFWLGVPEARDGKRIIPADAQRIGVPYWRRGYARRCRDLIYSWAFQTLDVEEIYGQAWGENKNSCCAMERYGFQLVWSGMDFNQKHGRRMEAREYVLTRERFEQKKRPRNAGAELNY